MLLLSAVEKSVTRDGIFSPKEFSCQFFSTMLLAQSAISKPYSTELFESFRSRIPISRKPSFR